MTSNILPIFWNLASSSKDTRLTSSAELISSLETFQISHAASKSEAQASSSDEEEEDEEEDEEEEIDDDDESGIEVDKDEDDYDEESNAVAIKGRKLDKLLAKENAEDVVYTVKRLVRGLGSSRDSSRLGFAVALTEVCRIDHDCPNLSSLRGLHTDVPAALTHTYRFVRPNPLSTAEINPNRCRDERL